MKVPTKREILLAAPISLGIYEGWARGVNFLVSISNPAPYSLPVPKIVPTIIITAFYAGLSIYYGLLVSSWLLRKLAARKVTEVAE